ncbi:AraC family transcriptional regulator [Paeniglutamicibacter sp. ABSL32-1]|uniref:AraC family transcriptional regulator n=1 Tax=Paeniglutamicibacter quisquiliarum TaxID=2849498 RepID=UPI001C2D51B4|nr:AraC family transcriptional regulator [Paeniglutamicibacter quisquiliarum]MBV1778368.1 AraC family transcriptional regulator [Paeniglutamicibacter quisquiliarum]
MDPLTHLLDGPRARRAFALRVVMDPNWSIKVQDRAPLTLMAMMSGNAWLEAGDERFGLRQGDVAIVRGPEPYTVSDDPSRAPDVVIHPGQRCTSPSGTDLQTSMTHGIRTWGNAAAGQTTMLIGTYETDAEIGAAVTTALPRIAVVPAGEVNPSLMGFLEGEIISDAPGQGSTIDRLLDVLLVHSIRAWVALHPDTARGWLAGGTDPLIARTLTFFHESPAEAWSLDSLAQRLNVSRATLAGRFRAGVGEPPMTYLANWRMLLASELLADPRLTTTQIAAKVGYGSPFALSTAFKRRFGVSPTGYRDRTYLGAGTAIQAPRKGKPARPLEVGEAVG